MLGIDLSTLSRPELQRLLKAARARGDAPLVERLEWELGSRGIGVGRPAPAVAVAPPPQDDPVEEDLGEDPGEASADVVAPEVERIAWEPIALEPLALEPITREPTGQRPAPARGGLLLVVGLVAGCLISAGAFWGLGQMNRSPAAGRVQAPAPRVMVMRPLEAAPTLAPAPPSEPAPVVPAVTAPAKPPVKPSAEIAMKAPPPKEEEIAKPDRARRPPPPAVRLAKADATTGTPVQSSACAGSTPADRLVCHDLSLQLFDLQLHDAYRRALNARADPAVVGEGQAAWRRARDEVSDPQRLARLYNQRIRELDAATATARENHPPP
jgi:uncharacterized protein YecT (DUF1311 family)